MIKKPALIRVFYFYWLLLLPLMSTAETDKSLSVDIIPAWNGYYKPGEMTETRIRLMSREGGTVIVTLNNLKQIIQLNPDLPYTTQIPLQPKISEPIVLRAFRKDDNNTLTEKELPLKAIFGNIVAFITTGMTDKTLQLLSNQQSVDHVMYLQPHLLPYTVQAYSTINAIILHYQGLKAMNESQIIALHQFIALCGHLITVQFPASTFNKFVNHAGCQGKGVLAHSNTSEFHQELHNLKVQLPENLPSINQLAKLLPEDRVKTSYSTLILFCFGYLFMLLIAILSKQSFSLIWLPMVASAIAFFVWYQDEPIRHMISWTEMNQDHGSAKYSTLLHVQGMGNWQESIELPPNVFLSNPLSTHNEPVNYAPPPVNTVSFNATYSLLSTSEWFWESSLQIDAPLCFEEVDNRPTVTNISNKTIQSGVLKWKEKYFPLTLLKPGQQWTAENKLSMELKPKLLQLMKHSSRHVSTALLIPFIPVDFKFVQKKKGWLLMTISKDNTKPMPCALAV